MGYKKTRITVKSSDPRKYPNLHTNMPYSCRIRDKEFLYKPEELLTKIAEYIVHSPNSFIVLKNKVPEEEKEKVLRTTLETLIRGHNLSLQLGRGEKYRCIKRAKKLLKKGAKK